MIYFENEMQSTADRKTLDVGANLFIGNLSLEVDEKQLYDTFSGFGIIIQPPKVSATKKITLRNGKNWENKN